MDEKRFSELFPEVEKDQGEEKQREFFAHMKRQLKPGKEWKLPGAAELAKRKKKQWKLTAYSATAAACLLLAILLPNLPVLLKISDEDMFRSGKKETSMAGFSESEQDTGVVTEDTSGERQPRMPEDEPGAEKSAEKQDGNNGNEKEEHGEKKNGTGEDTGRESEPEDAASIEEAKQEKNGKIGNEEKTEKEKSADSGADNGVGTVTDKGSSNGDGNMGSTEEKKPQKGSGSGKGTEGKENMAVTAEQQEEETADSSDEEIVAESACEEELPAADETVQNGTGAETAAGTEDTAEDMTVDAVVPDFAEIEEAAEETVVTEEAAETETSTETAKDDSEEMVPADLALETALTAWWQNEYGTADTGNTNGLEMEETSVDEQSMTKEEVQQGLLRYPYLCYGGQLWYEPVQKFRQNADGMELLGEAYVFQLKTTLLDAENGNRRQKVYVYGDRKDLSEILVRFQAEGVDYYYVYQAVSD